MELFEIRKRFFSKACLLFFLFILFSIFVAGFDTLKVDFYITGFLQKNIPRYFDMPFSLLSILGSAEISSFVLFCVILYLFVKKYYLAALGMVLFPVISFLELLGKFFIYHPSPPTELYRGVLNFNLPSRFIQTGSSYPSGHVSRTAFWVVFLLVLISLKQPKHKTLIRVFLVLLFALMLISRVYLGEHWMSDVLGGLLLGGSFGLFPALLFIAKRGKPGT